VRRAICLISILVALFLLTGQTGAFTPDDIVPVQPEKEKKMGESISRKVEKQYELVEDPEVQERFKNIGQRLARVCDRQEFVYHFKVLKPKKGEPEEKYYNAFTLPGGYVYMFEPLMKIMETDDKIAAVTAHEIGHTCARHVVKRLQSSLGANIITILAVATAQSGQDIVEANEALRQLMMAYSREDEFEADELSVKYVKKAGFDPNGVLESLLTLKKLRKSGREMTYMHYKSHPYLSERVAIVRREIKGYTDFDSYINLPKNEGEFR